MSVRFREVPDGIPIVWCPRCETRYGHRAKRNRMRPSHGAWTGLPTFECQNDKNHPIVYESELIPRRHR